MTSSNNNNNKHWPSMFKAKGGGGGGKKALKVGDRTGPSSSRSAAPFSSSEERVPELKERWNPRPEQIRILEAVFNSGLVTPMREDIMKIRARIEEYGQVADSSVFYWFQNRKSRSKNRQRKQRLSAEPPPPPPLPLQNPPTLPPTAFAASPAVTLLSSTSTTTSSSSSSGNNNPGSYIQTHPAESEYLAELPPFVYPADATPLGGASPSAVDFTQGFGFQAATAAAAVDDGLPQASFTELLTVGNPSYEGFPTTHLTGNFNQQFPATSLSLPPPPPPFPGEGKVTVMINEMAFEVPAGPFNIREAFGEGAVLFHYATGQAVLTNDWGFTLHPLQHGESYCLLRTSP